MRNPKIPKGAEVIRTYKELYGLIDAFFRGCYQLLILIGPSGRGKSQAFKRRLNARCHLLRGWLAPLRAYIETYLHRNKLLIFDDADIFWKKPAGRILLRSLTEHILRKLVAWTSTNKDLENLGAPLSFETTSKVALICNRFVFGHDDEYEAILDRGHLIYFDPTPIEIHKYVATWFWDQELFSFIGERLHLMNDLSSRTYLKAWERKKAGGDWKKLIEHQFCHDAAVLLIQQLEHAASDKPVEERVAQFVTKTGLSRATYFNYKRELESNGQLHPITSEDVLQLKVGGKPPLETDLAAEVAAAEAENESFAKMHNAEKSAKAANKNGKGQPLKPKADKGRTLKPGQPVSGESNGSARTTTANETVSKVLADEGGATATESDIHTGAPMNEAADDVANAAPNDDRNAMENNGHVAD